MFNVPSNLSCSNSIRWGSVFIWLVRFVFCFFLPYLPEFYSGNIKCTYFGLENRVVCQHFQSYFDAHFVQGVNKVAVWYICAHFFLSSSRHVKITWGTIHAFLISRSIMSVGYCLIIVILHRRTGMFMSARTCKWCPTPPHASSSSSALRCQKLSAEHMHPGCHRRPRAVISAPSFFFTGPHVEKDDTHFPCPSASPSELLSRDTPWAVSWQRWESTTVALPFVCKTLMIKRRRSDLSKFYSPSSCQIWRIAGVFYCRFFTLLLCLCFNAAGE